MAKEYDVVVIGGGPGGYVCAIRAAQLGLKVAVVEREEVGGVCLNWGCIPSKALLRNAEVLNLFNHADDYGVTVKGLKADMGAAIDRSRKVVDRMVKGIHFLLKKNKIDLITGTGRLSGPNRVAVEPGEEVTAKSIVISTGARPKEIPLFEVDGKTILTSKEALALREPPKSIAIVGGGAIGVEFAYFYRAYGTEVTIIEMLPHLVPTEDEEVSIQLERSLSGQGITIKAGFTVESVERVNGHVKLNLGPAGEGGVVECEKVLLGIGVTPNTQDLGLEEMGVALENGWIAIDDRMATNVPGVYAIGDVTGKLLLAHVASHQGIVAAEAIAGRETEPLVYVDMPRATYCQPQVASMGLTEQQAKDRGHIVKVGKFPFTAIGKAVALNATEGFAKLVADAETGELLGAHLVGHDVTELLSTLSMVRMLEGTVTELGRAVHAHPTMSEALMEAGLGVYGEALHM
ncbi:MAG: dihydrolipoyl dehydrogenase [Chloroflexi bacterium]|nr:dihydrolipoyl dehydrogenase [Chloroflexota bacterium]